MKKYNLVLQIFLCTIFALFVISSCSNTNAEESYEQQMAFNELLDDINYLNSDFGITTTKSGGREAIKTAADIAGYVAGNVWGADIGAWAGSAAGPAGSVVGFLVGKKYGGLVGSQICSLIAGYGYDLFSDSKSTETSYNDKDTEYLTINNDATIGEVHNFLLSKFDFNVVDYITPDGHLNIELICNKSIENAKQFNIEDDLCDNEEYIAFIKQLSAQIEIITYALATNNTNKSCEQLLTDVLIQSTNLSATEINSIFELSNNLMGSSELEEKAVVEYEQAFSDLVDNSKLDDNNKQCVKSVGSIAIRSNAYWYAEE